MSKHLFPLITALYNPGPRKMKSILRVNDDSCSSPVEPYDGSAEGVVAELPTPFYVTFVIAVGTVAAVILAALTVRMIFAIYTRCRRIRICWKRQVINYWRCMK